MNILRKIFKKRVEPEAPEQPEWKKEYRVVGVTMGFDARPHLAFQDGTILWGDADKILYREYWPADWKDNPMCWPIDPVTKEKLPIWR